MTERENFLRALEFRNPEWIPWVMGFLPASWRKYREELEKLVLRHPKIFRDYKKGSIDFDSCPPNYRKGYFRDNWGCLWHVLQRGKMGQVVEHPLADWRALDTYKPPDPLVKSETGNRDWEKIEKDIEEQKKKGLLIYSWGSGEELFTRLYYLRGFENLMIDIATDDPHLPRLIEMLTDYELKLVNKWLEIGVDAINFHTDIGTQNGLMISPAKFCKYIKPMFKKIFTPCRKAGTHVFLSSDGCLLEIVDDLIECGVSRHDPQLGANTLEDIEKAYKGKMCILLALDRQVLPFCKPEDIRNQVKEAVERLNLPEGGLMLWGGLDDETIPLENIEAVCQAFEEFCLRK